MRTAAFVLLLASCVKPNPKDPSTQAQPPTPPAATTGKEPDGLLGMTAAHNDYRARHCAPPLVWSAEVAAVAQRWADHLASKGCALEHSRGSYGENLAAGTAGTLAIDDVVAMWANESSAYDFARPGFGMNTGHFTQVVWVGSARLGCGKVTCGDIELWVCNYDPPGNMEGAFPENVKPESCHR